VARQPVCRQAPALGTNAYRDRGGVVLCAESDSCWDWRDPAPVCNDVLTNSMRCCYRTLPRTQRAQKPRTSPGHARPSSTAIDCLPVNTRVAPSTHAATRGQRLSLERAAARARRVIHDQPATSQQRQHKHTRQPRDHSSISTPCSPSAPLLSTPQDDNAPPVPSARLQHCKDSTSRSHHRSTLFAWPRAPPLVNGPPAVAGSSCHQHHHQHQTSPSLAWQSHIPSR
jgi:hypothetical protein